MAYSWKVILIGVTSVAITSDNKYIVSGGHDKTVRIWNLQDKTQEAVLQGHTICLQYSNH